MVTMRVVRIGTNFFYFLSHFPPSIHFLYLLVLKKSKNSFILNVFFEISLVTIPAFIKVKKRKMTQHSPSTGLVGFPCNSNGRTADTGVPV
jgi:hypothetical protein